MAVGSVVTLLQGAEALHVFFKQLLIVFLRSGQCRCGRGPFAQVQLLAWRHAPGLRIDGHGSLTPANWVGCNPRFYDSSTWVIAGVDSVVRYEEWQDMIGGLRRGPGPHGRRVGSPDDQKADACNIPGY